MLIILSFAADLVLWNCLVFSVFYFLAGKPSDPQNVRSTSHTNTTITVKWSKPNIIDYQLRTVYDVVNVVCETGSSTCNLEPWVKRHQSLSYVITGLRAFTTYSIKVCSFNDATGSIVVKTIRMCSDNKVHVTTQKGGNIF